MSPPEAIRLQRGSLKHRIKEGVLTAEDKEKALRRLFRRKGWDVNACVDTTKL